MHGDASPPDHSKAGDCIPCAIRPLVVTGLSVGGFEGENPARSDGWKMSDGGGKGASREGFGTCHRRSCLGTVGCCGRSGRCLSCESWCYPR